MRILKLFSVLLVAFSVVAAPPRLLIKLPTRSRPQQFFRVLDLYYQALSQEIPYLFLITCDTDDKTMNNPAIHAKFKQYPHLMVQYSYNKTKVEAYNQGITKQTDFDIVLVTSDDTTPQKHFDKTICKLMVDHFPDFDGVINFNDGYVGQDLNTLPVMGKKYFNRFGYIYHPSYKSLCCDNELTLVSKMLNREFYTTEVLVKHDHPANNQGIQYDALYQRNDQWWHVDVDNLNKRKANNFFLKSRYKLIDPKLSILICTLDERSAVFNRIYNKLYEQIRKHGLEKQVEILFFKDNRRYTVGKKRNELVNRSSGEYICFVDDDDDVHSDYVKLIYDKLQDNPDCVNLQGIITTDGKNPRLFIHSIKYKSWYEKDGIYYRPPNHLNPIKRDIALKFKFPEINYGEDAKWSMAIANSGLLKTEAHISVPYYFYFALSRK
jgi:hypothetical protein